MKPSVACVMKLGENLETLEVQTLYSVVWRHTWKARRISVYLRIPINIQFSIYTPEHERLIHLKITRFEKEKNNLNPNIHFLGPRMFIFQGLN